MDPNSLTSDITSAFLLHLEIDDLNTRITLHQGSLRELHRKVKKYEKQSDVKLGETKKQVERLEEVLMGLEAEREGKEVELGRLENGVRDVTSLYHDEGVDGR